MPLVHNSIKNESDHMDMAHLSQEICHDFDGIVVRDPPDIFRPIHRDHPSESLIQAKQFVISIAVQPGLSYNHLDPSIVSTQHESLQHQRSREEPTDV